MEIYKIITDSKPERCCECPMIPVHGIMPCGQQVERRDGGWTQVFNVPDNRCLIEVMQNVENTEGQPDGD